MLRLPLVVLGALLVAAVVVAVIGGSKSRPAPAPPPAVTRAPAVVASAGGLAVDPASYAGQPADAVISELRALGLSPSLSTVPQAGAPGTVVTIVSLGGAPLPAVVPAGTRVVVQEVGSP